MRQIDKQKMKIIGLNAKVQNFNKETHLSPIRSIRTIHISTQTNETIYSEEQIMIIYEKLNDSKEKVRALKEASKRSEQMKENLTNELDDLKILKNKYQEDSLEKAKQILDLEIVQRKYLEIEQLMSEEQQQNQKLEKKLDNLKKDYHQMKERVIELKDINQTMHDTLLVRDGDFDDTSMASIFRDLLKNKSYTIIEIYYITYFY